MSAGGSRVAFAMERHLGHQTYAENLESAVSDAAFEPIWIAIDYTAPPSPLDRIPLPPSLRAAMAGRRQVRRGIRSADPDAVVFNTQVPAALGGKRVRSRPYIAITDVTPVQYDAMAAGYGHRPDRNGLTRWAKHRINTRVFQDAQYCVGWSRWAAESIISDYGVQPDRVNVIPPGVETRRWTPGPREENETVRILFVGGEFDRKGGEHLLRAFAALPSTTELTLVTKSPVPRADRVTVIDDLRPNDGRLVDLFRSSDIFALPSLAETFGIAAVEASAAGLPIVVSDVGGLGDIVLDGQSGFLVPPGNQLELNRALAALVSDPELRRRFGNQARQRAVEEFDAEVNARRVFDLAQRCCADHSAQR